MGNRLHVEVAISGGRDHAAPRAAHFDSASALPHDGSGRARDHERDIAVSGFGAHALRNALTRDIAGPGLCLRVLADYLEIDISASCLTMESPGNVGGLDVTVFDHRGHRPQDSGDGLLTPNGSRNDLRAIRHIDSIENADPSFGIGGNACVAEAEMVSFLPYGENLREKVIVQAGIPGGFGRSCDRDFAISYVEDLHVPTGNLDLEPPQFKDAHRKSAAEFGCALCG